MYQLFFCMQMEAITSTLPISGWQRHYGIYNSFHWYDDKLM